MSFAEFSIDVAKMTQDPLAFPEVATKDNRSAFQRLLDEMAFPDLLDARTVLHEVIQDRAKAEQEKLQTSAARLAEYFGVSPEEVVQPVKKRARKGTDAAPLYRHPTDPDKTWNGKGRKPAWFAEAVAV